MKKRRSNIPLLIGIIISLCICIMATGFWIWNFFGTRFVEGISPAPVETVSTAPAGQDTTDPPTARATPTSAADAGPDSPAENLPSDVVQNMDLIQQQVIELRGLNPAGPFSRAILSREELEQRVLNDFFADYTPEEAADDARILAALGLLDPDYDLIGLFTELYSEQVLGFYDDETKEMVVVGSSEFGGPEKITYAHEYAHALQDENFDFQNGLQFNDETCEIDTEYCGALQALIEGEATLVELQWFFEHATLNDQQAIIEYYSDVDFSKFESYPAYLQKDFAFPYDQGYLFAEHLYNRGGWEAVNAAYANPPVTTEQILHPEKYPADKPVPVELPELALVLGDGWEQIDDNVLGEWYTYLMLAHGEDPAGRLDEDLAFSAAEGWGGDRYEVWVQRETGQVVLLMKLVWDTPQDKDEFAAAFAGHSDGRFGPSAAFENGARIWEAGPAVHLFEDTGEALIWVSAPDTMLAQQLLEAAK